MYTKSVLNKEKDNIHHTESSEEIYYPPNETCFILRRFHDIINKLFYKLGHIIANDPIYFIVVPILLTIMSLTGIQYMDYESDPETLISPTNGQGRIERSIVEELFPLNYSAHFDPSRLTRLSSLSFVFPSAKDNNSVLRVDVFNEIVLLDKAIRNLTIEWQGETYGYTDVCAKMNGECIENSVLDLQDFMPEIENGSMMLNYPIMAYPRVLAYWFGGAVVNETEGVMLEAKLVALRYYFNDDDWKLKERSHLYEGKILELLRKMELNLVNVVFFATRTIADELDKNAHAVFSNATLAFLLIIVFSVGSMFLSDWVRSKLLVTICGVISTCLATACAFGLIICCGVSFSCINFIAPFLLLGIGIDDMFVILSAWHRTKIQEDVPMRMAKTYREIGVSITITSLTNMLSFVIGSITPYTAVRIFCIYTGVSVLFTYFFCITFFGGCLTIAGRLEKNGRHNITGQPVLAKSKAENLGCCYKFWCAGGINPEDPWNPKDNQDHVVMSFFRDYIAKALNMPSVKALVIAIFLLYMGGAIYGCTTIKDGLEFKKIARDDSYAFDFFETENKYFRKYPAFRLQVIIKDNLNYSDHQTMKELLEVHDVFENLNCCTGTRVFTESWIRGFHNYVNGRPELKKNITDEKSFINVLKHKYLGPYKPTSLDVIFNEDDTKIIASRFIIQAADLKDSNADKDMMLEMRRTAENSNFNITVYQPLFLFYDQYTLVRYTTLQAIFCAAVVMTLVALVFIPSPLCSLWVAFSIVSIEIGVVGYMSLWSINLDTIAMINLIMCVGFSVDFSAHISYAYLTARATTPAQRVEQCLYNLGFPVVQGGLSTIVGVLVLSFTPSYIYNTFFKIVILVVIFGIMHALFLLPVMLSLFGPGSCGAKDKDAKPNGSVPEILHHHATTQSDSLSNSKNKNIKGQPFKNIAGELGLRSSESDGIALARHEKLPTKKFWTKHSKNVMSQQNSDVRSPRKIDFRSPPSKIG